VIAVDSNELAGVTGGSQACEAEINAYVDAFLGYGGNGSLRDTLITLFCH
jgi:hypothetical protein